MNGKQKYLVMLGVGDDRKARAAKFEVSEEAQVRKASGLMNFRVGSAKTDQAAALAAKLPDGKLFESGLGMVPLVRDDILLKLYEHLSFDAGWNSTGAITGKVASTDSNVLKAGETLWGAIKVGSTVLFFDGADATAFSWSAAIVVSLSKDGQTLELRWRDWPGFRPFSADRRSVALLRPDICS